MPRCQANTARGYRCKLPTLCDDDEYCHLHVGVRRLPEPWGPLGWIDREAFAAAPAACAPRATEFCAEHCTPGQNPQDCAYQHQFYRPEECARRVRRSLRRIPEPQRLRRCPGGAPDARMTADAAARRFCYERCTPGQTVGQCAGWHGVAPPDGVAPGDMC